MISIKVKEDTTHLKTIIFTSSYSRIIVTVADVIIILGFSTLIFFISLVQNTFGLIEMNLFHTVYMFVFFLIVVLLPINIIVFSSRIILTKNRIDKSIILQKQFVIKREPIIYRINENPYLKLVGLLLPWESAFGVFALNIVSDKKKDTMCPLFQQGWFVTKKEAVQISRLLEIPLSKEIGKLADLFTRI